MNMKFNVRVNEKFKVKAKGWMKMREMTELELKQLIIIGILLRSYLHCSTGPVVWSLYLGKELFWNSKKLCLETCDKFEIMFRGSVEYIDNMFACSLLSIGI